jgi:hypothetical protein
VIITQVTVRKLVAEVGGDPLAQTRRVEIHQHKLDTATIRKVVLQIDPQCLLKLGLSVFASHTKGNQLGHFRFLCAEWSQRREKKKRQNQQEENESPAFFFLLSSLRHPNAEKRKYFFSIRKCVAPDNRKQSMKFRVKKPRKRNQTPYFGFGDAVLLRPLVVCLQSSRPVLALANGAPMDFITFPAPMDFTFAVSACSCFHIAASLTAAPAAARGAASESPGLVAAGTFALL